MTILAEKINEEPFYDVLGIIRKFPWVEGSEKSLIELWNTCDFREQHQLIKDLFERFSFVDARKLRDISIEITKKIKEWGMASDNTYIAAIADKREVDGSTAGVNFLKNKFPPADGWNESRFISSITEIEGVVNTSDNLILFDDFIGSGNTFVKKKIPYLKKKLLERGIKLNSIKVISFAGMKCGIRNIEANSLLDVFCPIMLDRGITDFESENLLFEKKQMMKDLEFKLGEQYGNLKLSTHSLGFKESEALFQIENYNCPNNVSN